MSDKRLLTPEEIENIPPIKDAPDVVKDLLMLHMVYLQDVVKH